MRTMPRYCFVMLISKHDIIVKQSKSAHESLSRLSKNIVVKILTALKLYNVIIEHASNEIVLKFKFRKILTIIASKKFIAIIDVKKKFANNKFIFRKKIVDVTFFVNAKIKIYYDVRHISFLIKKNYAFLKLNHDYRLSTYFNRKFSQQKCDFF